MSSPILFDRIRRRETQLACAASGSTRAPLIAQVCYIYARRQRYTPSRRFAYGNVLLSPCT